MAITETDIQAVAEAAAGLELAVNEGAPKAYGAGRQDAYDLYMELMSAVEKSSSPAVAKAELDHTKLSRRYDTVESVLNAINRLMSTSAEASREELKSSGESPSG